MSEVTVAKRFVIDRLKGSGDLTDLIENRIYDEIAPATAVYPLVLLQYVSGEDFGNVGGSTDVSDCHFRVVAVDQGATFLRIEPIEAAVNAALLSKSGEIDGGEVLECRRLRPFKRSHIEQDKHRYSFLGAFWSLYAITT